MNECEFRIELSQMVMRRAAAEHLVDTMAFVAEVADRLQEDPVFGELILADDTRHLPTGKLAKLHGFTELDSSDQTLSMVAGKWIEEDQPGSINTSDIAHMRSWLEAFAEEALAGRLDDQITESSPAYQLATALHRGRESISCIRMHILTNQTLSNRYRKEARFSVCGVPAELHIWDLKRIQAIYSSGREREAVEIQLSEFGTLGISCIEASVSESTKSYLCVIEGEVLADLFERFGSRLLEGNVRSFLGMKAGVNKGIRATIQDKPGLFFAYNNGIAATAASADVESTLNGLRITRLSDLQIVNGGQTTASILRARKQDRLGLLGVAVPMKLTVVNSIEAHDLVPKIAEYANTQNKVAVADFFANHPFHRKIEEISRRLMPPAKADTRVQSKWFYERARGQYQNERLYLTSAGKRAFELQFPANQVINKTDLAKYDSVLNEKAYWVALGAQKNFMKFAGKFSTNRDKSDAQHWEEISPSHGDAYYQRIAAMALLWKAGESTVSSARGLWYDGDYRPQIVAYAWALIFHSFRRVEREPNLLRIWERQEVDAKLLQSFTRAAVMAQHALQELPTGSSNIGEWAKKEACWEKLSSSRFQLDSTALEWSVDVSEEKDRKRTDRASGARDDGIALQQDVLERSASGYWAALYEWPPLRLHVHGPDLSLLARATSTQMAGSIVSERDWKKLGGIRKECEDEGFRFP